MQADNSRVREDLANKEASLERLKKELEALRADADFKTLQISKLASELNSKGDLGANLRSDHSDLS